MAWRIQSIMCMLLTSFVWETGHCLCQPVLRKGKLCPVGWTKFNTSCYIFTQCAEWCNADDVVQWCGAVDGYVASVKSAEETDFIGAMVGAGIDAIIVGGRDSASEGEWIWMDGEPVVYDNWIRGEPNNKDGRQDCMISNVMHGYKWNDVYCEKQFDPNQSGYVCQRQL